MLHTSALAAYELSQAKQKVQDAIAALPAIHREVLTLYYLTGMDTHEVAKALGTSPNTIHQRLRRARSQLKEEITTMVQEMLLRERLPAGFTLRTMEAIQNTQIQLPPGKQIIPWAAATVSVGLLSGLLLLGNYLILSLNTGGASGATLSGITQALHTTRTPVVSQQSLHVEFLGGIPDKGPSGMIATTPRTSLRPQQGSWNARAAMSEGRGGICSAAVGRRIYVFGGGTDATNLLSSAEEYTPVTDTWVSRRPMPRPRVMAACAVVDDQIYVMGGITAPDLSTVSTVEVYDPVTDIWERRADMSIARMSFSATAVDGKIYAIGGLSAPCVPLSTVEVYDPATDTWGPRTDIPTPKEGLSLSTLDGIIYAIGGGTCPEEIYGTVEAYDPIRDEWWQVASVPTPRDYLASVTVDNRIYALGGHLGKGLTSTSVEVYTPSTDTWGQLEPMPHARSQFAASVVGNTIHAIGGTAQFSSIITSDRNHAAMAP